MNARMRRIDLFCKLMGPLTISLVAIASTEIAIYTTLGMNVASVLVEYVFIEQVTQIFDAEFIMLNNLETNNPQGL